MKHHESSAARFVPKQLAVRFPHVSAYVFLGAYACIIVVIAVICAAALGGGHDLSGTYRTDSFFPSPRLHSAAMEPLPLMTVRGALWEIQQEWRSIHLALYRRRCGRRKCCDGILQENSDTLYELSAEKDESDKVLYVSVVPKVSYWAWYGKVVTFYKQ